jgi:chemotaxis protein CheX
MSVNDNFFTIDKFDNYSLVKIKNKPVPSELNEFESILEMNSKTHIVLDCDSLSEIERECIRILLKIHLATRKENKFLKLINVNSVLLNCFKKDGVDSTLKFANNLQEALQEIGITPKRSISTDFIDSFLQSTIHVLKIQAEIDAIPGVFEVAKTKDDGICDISGFIGIICNNFNGSVIISFPENTFLNVMSKMLGEEMTSIEPGNMDGAAEITNMIFGQAKSLLNEKGFGLKMALPSVVLGNPDSFISLNTGPAILVPFKSTQGDFFVRIGLTV